MGVDDPEIDVQIGEQDDELSAHLDEKNIARTGRRTKEITENFFFGKEILVLS